jgi:uncharacterized delta-60 repeat protein
VRTVFGTNVAQEIFGVTVQDDGRIVVVGHTQQGDDEWALARYMPNGALDGTFGGDGRVTTEFGGDDFAYKVIQLGDGRLLVAGEADTDQNICDVALARYRPGGGLDTTFGGDGRVTTSFGPGCDIATGLTVQPDGKAVAVGAMGIPGSFQTAVARFWKSGARDRTFSEDGRQTVSFGSDTYSEFWNAAVTGSGKIVAGGEVGRDTGDRGDFILARFIG